MARHGVRRAVAAASVRPILGRGMPTRYLFARALQVMGMAAVLVGLAISVSLGFQDEGLKSMQYELYALIGGAVLFYLGRWLQRSPKG